MMVLFMPDALEALTGLRIDDLRDQLLDATAVLPNHWLPYGPCKMRLTMVTHWNDWKTSWTRCGSDAAPASPEHCCATRIGLPIWPSVQHYPGLGVACAS